MEERIYFPHVIGPVNWQMVEPFPDPGPAEYRRLAGRLALAATLADR